MLLIHGNLIIVVVSPDVAQSRMTEPNLDILSPRKGTPFSKLLSMCNGKHVDETDDELDSIHSSSAVSDDDVQPAEATSRSVIVSKLDTPGDPDKDNGDALIEQHDIDTASSVSMKVMGWDAGVLLEIAVGMAILAYEYNRWRASAATDE